ncbi:hypothetical protein IHV10_06440 [Fictibacillus sp. 5RED26]|uniref:hypothetical protein n=1 Tax=Fictibacillus sp. 5RED26 TaxID=2745876 RepID=UPI0018CE3C36|nr:hypothetical protein [Fictibacillus sp. 5RED26]MBH0156001.1 hypothetical protein [Fictibacillus sp. 5RED26]
MDIKLISGLVSATVALLIAILNHFIITPIKENRERKRQQLKNLYAPLYSLLNTRINMVKDMSIKYNRIMLGTRTDVKYFNKEYMEIFLLENTGYASDELISVWIRYSSSLTIDEKETIEFVQTVVKEFNQLKKDLGLSFNQQELITGIPEVIKEFRDKL